MKAAVIGAGRMGQTHMQVIQELGLELVGICDRSSAAIDVAKERFGIAAGQTFSVPEAMLEQARPECVIIATTAPTHCSFTCLAAKMAAKYILCEKPMGVSLEECDRMIDACRRAGAELAINHQMRFMEQYTRPKKIVRSDEFGGLSSVTVVAGNFGIAMNGIHYFEMFRYMTDEEPSELTAWLSAETIPNPRGAEFQDHGGAVRITTPSGKRFYLEAGTDQGHGVKTMYSGPRGQLTVDELAGKMRLQVRQPEHRDLPTGRYGMPEVETVIEIEPADNVSPTRAVLASLLEGNGPPTGHDGRLAVSQLVAAHVSHENGSIPVRPDDPNLPVSRVFPWA